MMSQSILRDHMETNCYLRELTPNEQLQSTVQEYEIFNGNHSVSCLVIYIGRLNMSYQCLCANVIDPDFKYHSYMRIRLSIEKNIVQDDGTAVQMTIPLTAKLLEHIGTCLALITNAGMLNKEICTLLIPLQELILPKTGNCSSKSMR